MTEQYMLLSEKGINPPSYVHHDIDLAVAEAKRLSRRSNCGVKILKVIGEINYVEVPVTHLKQVVRMAEGYNHTSNDLPF